MDAADALSRMLSRVNSEAMRSFVLPVVEQEKEHQQIQSRMQRLVRKSGDYKSRSDFIERIKAAVLACRSGSKLDYRQLRLACLGCCMALPPDGYTLLEDRETLNRLLRFVDEERDQPRLFAKLYGRLLKAYFGHSDASQMGEADRERLREFLAARAESVIAMPVLSGWGQVINEYPDLLGDQPGQQFAGEMLAGEWAGFKAVCERLGLTGETWLSGAVIREATANAVVADDRSFKDHIRVLLLAIGEKRFASLRDEILVKLIERYKNCKAPDVHNELRDFAVMAWKNPWLPLNQTSWSRVSDAARQMVSSWLKETFISAFFDLLAEDGRGDRRRFEFWRRYLDQIDDMFFILGRGTRQSTDANIHALLGKLDGRRINLISPDPANNAFIMLIGNAAIVEFSQPNNATYIYQRQRLPVSLESDESINITDLRSHLHVERLIHRDGGLSWQEQFEQKLLARFGLRPDISRHTAPRTPTASVGTARPPALQNMNMLDEVEFNRFVVRERLQSEDLRVKGGCLWVLSHPVTEHVEARLKDWGFKFRAGKGWWLQTGEN